MVDIKLTVSVTAALLVGAVVGGLVGHYAVPSSDPVSTYLQSTTPSLIRLSHAHEASHAVKVCWERFTGSPRPDK